jgi:hypothetical protein
MFAPPFRGRRAPSWLIASSIGGATRRMSKFSFPRGLPTAARASSRFVGGCG